MNKENTFYLDSEILLSSVRRNTVGKAIINIIIVTGVITSVYLGYISSFAGLVFICFYKIINDLFLPILIKHLLVDISLFNIFKRNSSKFPDRSIIS